MGCTSEQVLRVLSLYVDSRRRELVTMKILVTGACGYIGTVLVPSRRRAAWRTRVLRALTTPMRYRLMPTSCWRARPGLPGNFARRIVEYLVIRGYLPVTEPGGEGTREMSPPTSWQRGWFGGCAAGGGEGGGVEWVSRPAQPAGVQVICVLALHRAGTSLITRIINLLGVYLGPEDHYYSNEAT